MAGRKSEVTTGGPPAVCTQCRQTFRTSAVVDHRKGQYGPKVRLCPRCIKEAKAEKKRKKQENNPT